MAGLQARAAMSEQYRRTGGEIADSQMQHMMKQMEVFKTTLQDFARKHKLAINRNPTFRMQFQQMCGSVGVDPLASSKGMWAELLGLGDFYFGLAVQIVDVCISTRPANGGLIEMSELLRHVQRLQGKDGAPVSENDVTRALGKLRALGSGYAVLTLGAKQVVQSVPCEWSNDHTDLLRLAQGTGYVSVAQAMRDAKWTEERTTRALEKMLSEGMAMIDDQDPSGQRLYWFPGLVTTAGAAAAAA